MGRRSRQPAYASGGSSSPTFSPLDEPGSFLWLKGDTSGSFTMSGANILTWVDQSAGGTNTFTATLSNPIKEAAAIGGLQAVRFSGAQVITKALFSGPSASEMFVVKKNVTGAGVQVGLWAFGANATGNAHPNSDTITYEGWGTTSFFSTVTLPVVETTAHLYSVRSRAGMFIQSQNDVDTWSSLANVVGWGAAATLGQNMGGIKFNGWIGEMLAYDHILSSTRRGQVTTYLRTKWGV
jgi:hypothetical protein